LTIDRLGDGAVHFLAGLAGFDSAGPGDIAMLVVRAEIARRVELPLAVLSRRLYTHFCARVQVKAFQGGRHGSRAVPIESRQITPL